MDAAHPQVETNDRYRAPLEVYRAKGTARETTMVNLPALEGVTNAVTGTSTSAQLPHTLITSDACTRPADHDQWAREPEALSQAIASWVTTP